MRTAALWIACFVFAAAAGNHPASAAPSALPAPDADGWVRLFNGKDLDGWDGDPAVWRVEDGCIVGRADQVANNTFLIYRHPLADFTLRVRFKLVEKGRYPNSGVQYRSKVVDAGARAVAGYQADIGVGHWGDVHEERGRPTLAKGSDEAARTVRRGDWNEYEITAVGPVLTHKVNGVIAARFEETDRSRGATSGVIALQYHRPGDGFEVRFQDVRVKVLDAAGRETGTTRPAAAATTLPVPTPDEQAAARKLVRDLFAREYAERAPAARVALAGKLLALAGEPKESPASRYVPLTEARDLAVAAGDVKAALGATDRMASTFSVDGLEAKADVLAAAGRSTDDPRAAGRAAKLAIPLADDAAKAERFDVAERLLATAEAAARRGGDAATEGKARQRLKEVRERAAWRARAAAAERTLARAPDDPAANAVVGGYRCFARGDWAGGLPLLAKGADAALAALAKADLAQPQEAAARQSLADRWWDAGEKLAEPDRAAYRRRAGHWYELARPGLTGLAKALAEKRLAELAPAATATAVGPVDLLQLVDPDADAVSGEWQRAGVRLTSGAGQAPRIVLPASADGGYELTVRFVRQAGDDAVLIYLPAGRGGTWLVLSGWGGRTSALYNVGGKRAAEVPGAVLVNGREYRVDARVVLDGDDADVTVRLNGNPFLHWKGRQTALALDERWGLPTPKNFGLGAVQKTTFSAATVRALSGGITPLRP